MHFHNIQFSVIILYFAILWLFQTFYLIIDNYRAAHVQYFHSPPGAAALTLILGPVTY